MMSEYILDAPSSPFDEALASPLISGPTRKKFSVKQWFQRKSDSAIDACNVDSLSLVPLGNSSEEKADRVPKERRLSADQIIFGSNTGSTKILTTDVDHKDRDYGLSSLSQCIMHEVNPDIAIMTEREEEFGNIAQEMRQINDIQKDMALLVDSQENCVNRLEMASNLVLDRARSGLEALVSAIQIQESKISSYSQTKFHCYALVFCAVALIIFCYLIANYFGRDYDTSSDNEYPDSWVPPDSYP